MLVALPDDLAYLNDVITKLESFEPESLGDDNPEAIALVVSAVRARIHGMSEEDAEAILQTDMQTLAELSADPVLAQSPVNYVYGVFMGMTMYADIGELLS